MSLLDPSFWRRVEWVVMAAACGTLLGTGLLAGAISLESCDLPADPHADNTPSPPTASPSIVFHKDKSGTYRSRVVINGVPLQMIVDTGATHSLLSEPDARRVFRTMPAGKEGSVVTFGGVHPLNWQEAASVEIAGKTLARAKVGLVPAAPASVIGLNWLSELGPILLDPGDHFDD